MTLVSLSQCEPKEVIDFLLPYESSCIRLCELVKNQAQSVMVIFKDERIWGVLGFESVIVHCLPNVQNLNNEERALLKGQVIENLRRIVGAPEAVPEGTGVSTDPRKAGSPKGRTKKLTSINGAAAGTDFLVECVEALGESVHYRYDYVLMEKRSGNCPVDLEAGSGEEIVACDLHMEEDLMGLQRDYLNVEVAGPGEKMTDLYVRASLAGILKNQVMLGMAVDGELVAKANTSGRGWQFVQIGGVFTHPLYRRNGYARVLVGVLCNRILRGGKFASLFVKNKNDAAHELYKSMGFLDVGPWSIAYYR